MSLDVDSCHRDSIFSIENLRRAADFIVFERRHHIELGAADYENEPKVLPRYRKQLARPGRTSFFSCFERNG
jgi:hypothetical protein